MSIRKKSIIIAVLFSVIVSLFGELFLYAFAVRASAAESVGIDDTSIDDDLSYVKYYNYPKNAFGEHNIISLMEYCYSDAHDYSSVYNLYVYVYNPTEKPILLGPEYNSISLYFDEEEQDETPKRYLEYLDRTENHRFYKFKLYDSSQVLEQVKKYAASNNGKRAYEIGGLEIHYQGDDNPTDCKVAKTFTFEGYAAFCDENKTQNETLTCTTLGNDVIPLTLKETYYRFDSITKDKAYDIMPTLSSVYFSVPSTYFKKWGDISNIQAQWYEYKTEPIFVTSDSGAYSGLWDMRNIEINEYGQKYLFTNSYRDSDTNEVVYTPQYSETLSYWRVFWEETVDVKSLPPDISVSYHYFAKTYNAKCRDDIDSNPLYDLGYLNGVEDDWFSLNNLQWLFYEEEITGAEAYVITSEEMKSYMRNYTYIFPTNETCRGYSENLFTDKIDENRILGLKANAGLTDVNEAKETNGLVVKNFIADMEESFKVNDKSQSAWDRFWNGQKITDFDYTPIVFVSEGDLVLNEEEFSEKYLVNPNDVATIKSFCKESFNKGEIPTLLRFAVTDYYASSARFDYAEEDKLDMSEKDGYVAQETVFLDFDVLSLTFEDSGSNRNIIPVVASPIDIIHDLTPPEGLVQDQEWWQILVALLGLILLVVIVILLWPFISFVLGILWAAIKVLVGAIMLPFRLLWNMIFKRKR